MKHRIMGYMNKKKHKEESASSTTFKIKKKTIKDIVFKANHGRKAFFFLS